DARAGLELDGLPLNGGDEAEIVEDTGPQLGRDAAHALDNGVDAPGCGAQPLGNRARGFGAVGGESGKIELEAGERLAELVVDLARDARALLLPDVLQIDGERAQLLVRLSQALLGTLALAAPVSLAQRAVHSRCET